MRGFFIIIMKKTIILVPAVLIFTLFGFVERVSGQTENKTTAKFPNLTSEDLNGKAVTLPADFPGNPTLVLMAFESKQQDDIDKWIDKLQLKTSDAIPWMELAVVGSKFKLMKPVIDGGMRKGVTGEKNRARVVTIYSLSLIHI